MFLLESPHRGDSSEYTQYTIFNMNKKNTMNYPKSAAIAFFSKGLKKEFETAVVNEPSVFEPLKFYCSYTMVCPPVQEIINEPQLVGYLHVQTDKPWYTCNYSYCRTSMARTLMARLPRLFQTRS